MSDLNTLLDAHEARAFAADTTGTRGISWADLFSPDEFDSDRRYLIANDPATVRAFIAVARAAMSHIVACDVCVNPDPCAECRFHDWITAVSALKEALDERP